jgi:hypothetical protein
VNDLFVMAVWAVLTARIACLAFWGQATKLAPVMRKFRQGMLPIALACIGFAPFTQAHNMPGQNAGGSNFVERPGAMAAFRDGISLDEAVSRAEQQYRARVVRTDVQDEDGRKVYVLKLLSEDGRVFQVRIDAATGRMR